MKKYDSTREIYNPCAGIYIFDFNFPEEIETDNIENYLENYLHMKLPAFEKEITSNGSIIYIIKLPRLERYTFTEI